jgi:hypothetical protein
MFFSRVPPVWKSRPLKSKPELEMRWTAEPVGVGDSPPE